MYSGVVYLTADVQPLTPSGERAGTDMTKLDLQVVEVRAETREECLTKLDELVRKMVALGH